LCPFPKIGLFATIKTIEWSENRKHRRKGFLALEKIPGAKPLHYIWSPWRMKYIENSKNEGECVFCTALSQEDGPENLIVVRGHKAFVILNRYPYTSGHLMVVPYIHCSVLEGLDAGTRAEIMELTNQATQVLGAVYHPQGFNLGMNIGEIAGAGIAEHIHLHVVPRWGGDTNFMSSLAETRVLPESLEDTYSRVRAGWQ
jgi:ATP adenylyltransferase